ncbi:glycoside hydrolase family 97 catalytic domain-containing protein, partial [Bacteroidota bacterium]
LSFSVENENGKKMDVIFRAFNDGIAYRYYFPEENKEIHTITREYSSFNLPDEGYCWSQAYDTISKWTPAYETFYERKMNIGTSADPNKNGWSFPITFHTNDIWILITESNLDGSYPASHLQAECENGEYHMRWPEEIECFGEYSNKPESDLPWYTPWRVIIAGPTPATILESTMVTDLADPCKLDDTSWIKPGRAAWSWWSDSDSPQLVREQKRFVDLAVEMSWEYNLIDANWDNMKDGSVTEAIEYGNKKGIGSLLWYNSGGSHNIVTEAPRNRMLDPVIRKEEFKKLAEWGVKGVKVDFFQSDKQTIIQQYIGILEDAAANKVMANFHGCTLPRGWNRTYPNMVTLESARGGESYKFDGRYPANAPWHNTVLPFTRNAVGPMDYTPVMLTDHTYPHLTSFAHELATAVVFESGIIHMADNVETYLGLPDFAKDYLKNVPAAWDEIKFIDGYPGEFVLLARRSGKIWYVSGLNGTNKAMEIKIPMSLFDLDNVTVRLIMDGTEKADLKFNKMKVGSDEVLKIMTIKYGGFVGTITAE